MNFLAHCALAEDAAAAWGCNKVQQSGLVAGAVLGDFVKGPVDTGWPQHLQAGVRLHRKIDALSNQNPHLKQCSQRFPKHLRRLAPIFVDVLADYYLARNWADHYSVNLEAFSTQCYHHLSGFTDYLSSDGRRFFAYMQEVDLLANYHQWQHVERGLQSVLRRLGRKDLAAEVFSICRGISTEAEADLARAIASLRSQCLAWNAFTPSVAPQSS